MDHLQRIDTSPRQGDFLHDMYFYTLVSSMTSFKFTSLICDDNIYHALYHISAIVISLHFICI